MVGRVGVVGAGIAGLAAAWHLVRKAPHLEVTILEGSSRVGGKLRLEQVGDIAVDVGAESVLARRPEAIQLFEELGLADRVTHPARVPASIVSGGVRRPMPTGTLMGVPSDPESVRGLLTDAEVRRLSAEQETPPVETDVSVGELIDARLGPAVTDKLVEPLLAGVYAGNSRRLSLQMAVPSLFRAATEGTSLLEVARSAARHAPAEGSDSEAGPPPVFATVAGGLGTVPVALASRLADLGVDVRTGTMVRRLQRRHVEGADPQHQSLVLSTGPTTDVRRHVFDAVILATPAAPTARLLRTIAPDAAERLAAIEYASMAIVTLVLAGPAPELLEGSGFLVPPTEQLTIKASTFSSVKWPWLAAAHPDRTVLRASIGRHGEEAVLHRPDDDLVATALEDLTTVLGRPLPSPLAVHVQRWGGALPQYAVGHLDRVAGLTEPAPGVALAGAVYGGVGVPACIASGRRAADAVLTRLQGHGHGLR
ncbi:MAG TPA: protoporphyrinogen oxidase [Intrasporangium sp.]|uniref:protoporphyrinogen oxidase n=1 Tax=Intrasporangium sp. TaxID=1925024 RepID=UPI002B47923A|nr:protoporphyrinogen oxidase [Intrasporangium sp.]HKX67989.1 protoporphyrinogen oxidase [Intrasporangium sp.]